MEGLPSTDRLRTLLLKGSPRIFWFEAGQTAAERAAMVRAVPEAARRLAREIMVRYILEYLSEPEYADKPLLWFMATEDEVTDDVMAEEARAHSYDWRLILHEDEKGLLCDFNGWPGDNEAGAGLYLARAIGHTALLFSNGDSSLDTEFGWLGAVVRAYQRHRQGLGREDGEGGGEDSADEDDEGEGVSGAETEGCRVHALIASALAPLGGFAADAADFVMGFAMSSAKERDHCAFLGDRPGCIRSPTKYAAKRGDLLALVAEGYTFRATGCFCPPDPYILCPTLAKKGNLGLLRWAYGLSPPLRDGSVCPWDDVVPAAKKAGQLLVLRWARAVGLRGSHDLGPLLAEPFHTLEGQAAPLVIRCSR